ncbi:MAG TPA: trypsin-like peptidase domain-containing protein [Thermoclostridium caenicola]|nr:trypsin-like peptidase domain-containing protein [Thermoclostridium caenicola]
MLKLTNKYKWLACITLAMALLFASCSVRGQEDNKPPSTPVLTIKEVRSNCVSLVWSESYDDSGIDEYRLYRNGDILAYVDDTEYDDYDVTPGKQYEYYVVAYDKAGNRSSKSVRQTVKIDDASETVEPVQTDDVIDLNKLAKSTVRLYILDDDFICIGTGSGTIMNEQGYILTNFHCVGDDYGLYNSEGYVAIALTDDVRVQSQPQYFAQYRGGNMELDLAVVQIVEDINGNKVYPGDLKLIPARIGNSDDLNIGDEINILGYPGVGGDTITFTAGKVSGFVDMDYDNGVDWIKTDAIVNHGNSGGTAINGKGEMIGVPTLKRIGYDSDIMFYLKPINQAIDVLEEAYAQSGLPELPRRNDPYENGYADGVIDIYGYIVDAYTFEPIEGAVFLILKEGITYQEFSLNAQDSMILTYGLADEDGFFYCPDVPVGGSYAVIVGAEGYAPIFENDAIVVGSDETEDWNLGYIYLEAY